VKIPGETKLEHAEQQFTIIMDHIYFHLSNAIYHYRQKKGLIKMSDDILADLMMRGEGARIEMVMKVSDDRQFRCTEVHCNIDSLQLKVKEAKHNILYAIFKPILESRIKRNIEEGIEERLRLVGDSVGTQLDKTVRSAGAAVSETAEKAILGK